MRPYVIPPNTTVHSVMMELLAREHEARVPAQLREPPYRAVVKLRGEQGRVYTVSVVGNQMTVTEGESAQRDLWLISDMSSAQFLLDDAQGAQKVVPASSLQGEPLVQIASDPRLVQRLRPIDGTLLIALTGVPGRSQRLWMALGCGPRGVRYLDEHEPDASVEIPFEVFGRLASGAMDVQSAKQSGQLRISGRVTLAMQFALAAALLSPVRK